MSTNDDLAQGFGAIFASLLRVVDSKSPEEAGANLETGMNILKDLKGESPILQSLRGIGEVVGGLSQKFNDAAKTVHEKCAAPAARELYASFLKDPSTFVATIPSQYRYDATVTKELAAAYGLRDTINEGKVQSSTKVCGLVTYQECLTLQLLSIQDLWNQQE